MEEQFTSGKTKVRIVQGSALDQTTDALVNAANRKMRGGGGIDGAIHAKAGPLLLIELVQAAPRGAFTGTVVTTQGYNTGFKRILHVAGPFWKGGVEGEHQALQMCYNNCLVTMDANMLGKSLTFPSISTGVFGYPLDEAALIAVSTVWNYLGLHATDTKLHEVVFAMFKQEEYDAFVAAARKLNLIAP